ncbi:MAG: response regulator [Anaerolineae bacterium]|nr:response regulator [Anaerolineae bacterium]
MQSEKPKIIHERKKGRILIVDDDADFALSLLDVLESRGYQVEIAHDVPCGREKAEQLSAQVALVDIRLRRDSGINLIAQLKEINPDILCVMMTAYAAIDNAIAAIHEGAYDYLQKPLDMRYLLTTLDRCFEKLQLENEKTEVEAERERLLIDLKQRNLQLDDRLNQLRKLNAEIVRLQHLLQSTTNSMPSALIVLDINGRVLLWNPAAEALTGQAALQVQGQSLWQACPELCRYRDLFEQALHERHVVRRHKEQLTTESGVIHRDVDVFPLSADDIEGAVLHIDDVTERVRIEEMMRQSAKMASVGRLAAGIAHEINNPLSAMMQSAQMLQMTFDTQRPHTRERLQARGVEPAGLDRYLQEHNAIEYLKGIRSAGERAAKIVSNLLSFSRKSSQPTLHDLNVLVEQTLNLAATDYDLRKKYDFREIEIVRELAPDLPKVLCDGQQIQQVVLNLVHNAAQGMEKKKMAAHAPKDREYQPRLTLRTSLVKDEREDQSVQLPPRQMVRLEVEDNGPGLSGATQAQLFEPFFTTKDEGEGTGLGLWLAWSIVVEQHQGRIWGDPSPEGGARFVIELPVDSTL